jgi:hypothetical protein
MTTKLMWVIRAFEYQKATQAVLGKAAYQRIFKEHGAKVAAANTPTLPLRVIKGEVVGNPMTPGIGDSLVNPTMCTHPLDHMQTRGNKNQKWWTCLQCQSRWVRLPMVSPNTKGVPTDQEVVSFGRYVGYPHKDVLKDKGYCNWIVMTAEAGDDPGNALMRMAQYIVKKEQQAARRNLRTTGEMDVEEEEDELHPEATFQSPVEHPSDTETESAESGDIRPVMPPPLAGP